MEETTHHWLHYAALGTALATGAIIVAPYLLPALNVGSSTIAGATMSQLHVEGLGIKLAGSINTAIHAIPFIGHSLSAGGLWANMAVGVTGIGGVLLGRFIEKKQDGTEGINWGKVIRYSALATSFIIALPAILTGVTIGITYLASLIGGATLASSAMTFCAETLGATGTVATSAGAFATLPHLLTCGISIVPAALAWILDKKMHEDKNPDDICMKLQSYAPAIEGKPCHALVTLTHRDTKKPVTASELAVMHTQKLHLFIADQSLQDYHHIHPKPTMTAGEYQLEFTPHTSNAYHVWADVTTTMDAKNHVIHGELAAAHAHEVKPAITPSSHAEQGDLRFDWQAQSPLMVNNDCMVNLRITDKNGKTINDLEPVMGAYAHLVGFSADGQTLVHCHPLGDEPKASSERGQGELQFHVMPKTAGATQFYLQIRRNGEDCYIPFGQEVGAPDKFVQRLENQGHAAHSHAHAFAR